MASTFSFDAIGTQWQIDIEGALTQEGEAVLLGKIMDRISVFDWAYSRFRQDSLVTRMSRLPGEYILPSDALEMFEVYRTMYELTGGLFTPLIGNTLVDAGYDAEYSLKQKKPLEKPIAWDEAISYTYPTVSVRVPVLLDFGAAGKGYLIDLVGRVLEEYDVHSYCIDAGGDILHRNIHGVPLRVGLEHPQDLTQVIGVVPLLNKSLCASAGNRRAWEKFHHVINPETLESPRHILATWTLADKTIVADALSTGLFFVSPEILSTQYDFEYLILRADYSFEKSENFPGEIFSQ